MSQENVESFERGTEAYNRRDVDGLLETLDAEVERLSPTSTSTIPRSGTWVIESSGSATSARGASRVGW